MLLQYKKPVYFSNKALAEAQKRVCGHRVRVISSLMGHGEVLPLLVCMPLHLENRSEALEAVLSKSINQATPRLQRILIRTFPYHFTVHYIPGLTNQLADCLSQL